MRLLLVAAGTRLPDWVNRGFEEYAGRLAGEYRLELKEIALGQRAAGASQQAIAREGERMLSALPASCFVVALQVGGRSMSSEQLAKFLESRAQDLCRVACKPHRGNTLRHLSRGSVPRPPPRTGSPK